MKTKGRPLNKRLAAATEKGGRRKRVKLSHTVEIHASQAVDDVLGNYSQYPMDPPAVQSQGDGIGRRRCGRCKGYRHYATTCERCAID